MKKIIDVFIFLFIYIVPLIIFFNIYKKRIGIVTCSLIGTTYIILSIFSLNVLSNLFPFLLVIINIRGLKEEGESVHCSNSFFRGDYVHSNFNIKNIKILKGVKYGMISYVITCLISIISYYIFRKLNINLTDQQIINEMVNMTIKKFLITIPVTIVFAPVVEEFIFRYILFQKLFKQGMGVNLAAILSSAIFAAAHYNIKAFPMLFVIALINCYLIEKKGYWYAVINHFIFNFITIMSIFILKI